MSSTTAGIVFLASLIVALALVHVPLGDYMYRVYTTRKDSRVEKVVYQVIGADPEAEQTWGAYARSVLAFSAVSILFLFFFQLVQGKLPLHLNDPGTADDAGAGLEHRRQLRHQHQLAGLLRRIDPGPPRPDGRAGGAELRLRRGRHGRRRRAGARLRPHQHR